MAGMAGMAGMVGRLVAEPSRRNVRSREPARVVDFRKGSPGCSREYESNFAWSTTRTGAPPLGVGTRLAIESKPADRMNSLDAYDVYSRTSCM